MGNQEKTRAKSRNCCSAKAEKGSCIWKNHRIYLNEGFFYRAVESEVLFEEVPIDFSLKDSKNNFELSSLNGMPKVLGDRADVFLYGTNIYIPKKDFCYKIKNYLDIFSVLNI